MANPERDYLEACIALYKEREASARRRGLEYHNFQSLEKLEEMRDAATEADAHVKERALHRRDLTWSAYKDGEPIEAIAQTWRVTPERIRHILKQEAEKRGEKV